jgi:hypothetical protein
MSLSTYVSFELFVNELLESIVPFAAGVEKPTHGHGTLVAIPLLAVGSKPQSPNVWSAAIEKNMPDAKAVRILVKIFYFDFFLNLIF